MDNYKLVKIILIIVLLIGGSLFFGTSYLVRGCRYNPCQTDFNSCNENCRQALTIWSDSLVFNQSTITQMYQDCNMGCQNTSDQCMKQYLPTKRFEARNICKYLGYK